MLLTVLLILILKQGTIRNENKMKKSRHEISQKFLQDISLRQVSAEKRGAENSAQVCD